MTTLPKQHNAIRRTYAGLYTGPYAGQWSAFIYRALVIFYDTRCIYEVPQRGTTGGIPNYISIFSGSAPGDALDVFVKSHTGLVTGLYTPYLSIVFVHAATWIVYPRG